MSAKSDASFLWTLAIEAKDAALERLSSEARQTSSKASKVGRRAASRRRAKARLG
jgi:hypothetical protein